MMSSLATAFQSANFYLEGHPHYSKLLPQYTHMTYSAPVLVWSIEATSDFFILFSPPIYCIYLPLFYCIHNYYIQKKRKLYSWK